MCKGARIVVIAPDPIFRRSLCFLLEAEDYVVATLGVGEDIVLAKDAMDCVVLDESALSMIGVTALGCPVVMLVDRSERYHDGCAFHLVEKPMLGEALLRTVRSCICAERCPANAVLSSFP